MRRLVLGGLLTLPMVLMATGAAVAEVDSSCTVTTLGGTGVGGFSGDGGPSELARINHPRDSVLGPDGSLYITDTDNNRVRRIAPDGTMSTFAGNGSTAYNGDGIPATQASLWWPHDVAVDPDGVVYIADSRHHRIRRVDLDGTITTIAGTGRSGSSGDGQAATNARLKNPKSVVVHGDDLYIAGFDHKIRRIELGGARTIQTVAGNGVAGYSGDGGSATQASLYKPQRIQVDSAGTIYVADTGNSAVRRIDAAGRITTVAGTGVRGYSGDGGPAVSARLNQPRGIALEGDGTLYVTDSNNHRIRRVDLASGTITTVAGTGRGYAGDGGSAGAAKFYQPRGLTVIPGVGLVVADTLNSRMRLISCP